jgi:hypothetical protein
MSQDEHINAFGTNGWRQSIRNSVNYNHDYLFPPAPKPEQPESPQPQPASAPQPEHSSEPQPQPPAPTMGPSNVVAGLQTGGAQAPQPVEPPANCHSDAVAQAFRPEESASSSNSSLATHLPRAPRDHSFTPSEAEGPLPQAPSPHTPLPPTSAEFVEQVLARLKPASSAPPATSPQPAQATQPAPAQTRSPIPTPAPGGCHSERSEESAFSCDSPLATHHSPLPQTPATQSTPPSSQPACPEQGRRDNAPEPRPSASPREPNRDAPWLHFGDSRHIPPDSKLL